MYKSSDDLHEFHSRVNHRSVKARRREMAAALLLANAVSVQTAYAQQDAPLQLEPVVVSASRTEQRLSDAPAAIPVLA